jgi:hypothetical protein
MGRKTERPSKQAEANQHKDQEDKENAEMEEKKTRLE